MFRIVHPNLDAPPKEIPEQALAGFASSGWVLADEQQPQPVSALPMPTRSASAAAWKTWAVAAGGVPYSEAMAATRDELADRFRPSTTPPTPGKGTDKTKES